VSEEPPAGLFRADPKCGGQKALSCSPKLTMSRPPLHGWGIPPTREGPLSNAYLQLLPEARAKRSKHQAVGGQLQVIVRRDCVHYFYFSSPPPKAEYTLSTLAYQSHGPCSRLLVSVGCNTPFRRRLGDLGTTTPSWSTER